MGSFTGTQSSGVLGVPGSTWGLGFRVEDLGETCAKQTESQA